jgi:hypothetical protein
MPCRHEQVGSLHRIWDSMNVLRAVIGALTVLLSFFAET